jgi:DNA-binding CsgD family transcriptional regulator
MVFTDLAAIETAFSEAATNPAAWAWALDVVAAQTEACGAVLIPIAGNLPPNLPCSDRVNGSVRYFLRGARPIQDELSDGRHVTFRNGVDHLQNADEMNIPAQDLFAPVEGWWAGIKVECGDRSWCLSIQRSLQQQPFSPEEKCELAQLSKSLSWAATISRNIGFVTTKAALDAFEFSSTAVLLIDRFGSIFRANQSAERLLEGGPELSRGKLVCKDQTAARAIEQALCKFLATSAATRSTPMPICRYRKRPLLVYLLKLSSLSGNPFAECQAMAVLVDPDRRWMPTEIALRASFGFTPAEAKLAARISSGAPLNAVAASLGITKQTLKSLLKIVFAKAGVHRQAELVALIGGLRVWQEALEYEEENPLKALEVGSLQQDSMWRDISFSLKSPAASAGHVASAGKLPVATASRRRDGTVAPLR